MTLSILCVTKGEQYSRPFLLWMNALATRLEEAEFVVAVDGDENAVASVQELLRPLAGVLQVESKGYIESVLDQAVAACAGEYVLRLDDDERCSPAMEKWLEDQAYVAAPHWKFPRAHVSTDSSRHAIVNPPLWPDHQTRLSLKEKSGGRRTVHAGSPYGGGKEAPVLIEHWKFRVKDASERRRIAEVYDSVTPGYGTGGMKAFNLPEEVFTDFVLRPIAELSQELVSA